MALTSPGVEVTIIDESQYLPAPQGTVPLVVVATAQNKANPTGVGVAQATLASNAGKLFQVTSQRDLVTLYGNPFFYTTANGTPIQGYELNEYGLLAAYSALGISNRCYVLRADIDLASLVGQTGRPSADPENGTFWLDTTTTTWGLYEWNADTQVFDAITPIVITDSIYLSGAVPVSTLGSIGDYAVNAIEITDSPSRTSDQQFFYKNRFNQWVSIGSFLWLNSVPTIVGTTPQATITPGGNFTINLNGDVNLERTIAVSSGDTITDLAIAINNLDFQGITAGVVNGKLNIYSRQLGGSLTGIDNLSIEIGGDATVLADAGLTAGTYYQPTVFYGTAAQAPLWQTGQNYPAPSGSIWIKMGEAGNGFTPVLSEYNSLTGNFSTKVVTLAADDLEAINNLDPTGGKSIPEGTVYAQYSFGGGNDTTGYGNQGSSPTYFYKRLATGPMVATGDNTDPEFANTKLATDWELLVNISVPGSSTLSSYTVALTVNTINATAMVNGTRYMIRTVGTTDYTTVGAPSNTVGVVFTKTGSAATGNGTVDDVYDAQDFVDFWIASAIPFTTAVVTDSGAIQITHTEGGIINLDDTIYDTTDNDYFESNGIIAEIGFTPGTTEAVKTGISAVGEKAVVATGNTLECTIRSQYGFYTIVNVQVGGTGYSVGDIVSFPGTEFGGSSPTNNIAAVIVSETGGVADGVALASTGTSNAVNVPTVTLSNWVSFDYTANEGAPTQDPVNDTNWFYSVVDEVDIMVNTTAGWRGYKNVNYNSSGFPLPSGTNLTDPNGPLVSPTEPTTQSDGTALEYGDIWINTTNLEDYPVINRWQATSAFPSGEWVTLDNTDQTSSTGVLFADARWAGNDNTDPINDPIPTIKSLLTSNYLDLDAPDDALYPVGMLLFNTRRSGYNVKQFRVNYFNLNSFPDEVMPTETNAWVTASGLQSNGAPFMGRKAQRNMVVQSLRSVIDTNTDIRDEDNFFNLIVTPNYPECQPNMVVLNADRGETGYILGDTPMRLPDDATQIQAWATNAAGAGSTGENGLVTRNTYLGLFYPSGLAPDLNGNLVAVPSTHMMLRTFIRNDQIAYPWFAAAGVRRGVIDNATSIGYLDSTTGEFVVIKTRIGIRDVLYVNFINPMVFFTGQGLLNYGNKTSFNSQSALDRTNVARLVAFVRRQLTLAARPFVFEPNDALTRKQITGVVESLMLDLQAKRGIYDYLVVCDESNNTPQRIDRNELWVDVALEPIKAAEFIYIPVRILNTGELSGA